MAEFVYEDLLPLSDDPTSYRLLTTEGVRVVEGPGGRQFLEVDPEALRLLTETAMHDIAHYLRPAHLRSCAGSSTTRTPATTTGSWRSTCSRTPTSPRAVSCRCARTPAPRS